MLLVIFKNLSHYRIPFSAVAASFLHSSFTTMRAKRRNKEECKNDRLKSGPSDKMGYVSLNMTV